MDWRKKLEKATSKVLNLFFYLCLALAVWMLVQVCCYTSFKIPSDSMEPELLAGDRIVVDKMCRGARLFDVLAALRDERVTIRRLPAFGNFRHNDVLVFNFPYKQRWDSICFDVMKYYVKRCIALPGDTLEIRNGYFNIKGWKGTLGNLASQERVSLLTKETAPEGVMNTFPWNEKLGWTIKEFGPLPVPAKGQVVKMDSLGWLFYRQLIGWEQEKPLRMDGKQVCLGDSVIREYCFKDNYYFVAGDNAENSQDSRYWGMLPEEFIVGKAVRVWYSNDPDTGEMRWKRIFKKIK
ncbi:signal peptidase I [Bacteroides sp.]